MTEVTTKSRELDWLERYFHYEQQHKNLFGTLVIYFENFLKEKALIKSFQVAQKNYPLLQSRIVDIGKKKHFLVDDKEALNIEVRHTETEEDIKELLYNDCLDIFEEDGLQWRACLLKDRESGLIKGVYLNSNHTILDATSWIRFLTDIKKAYFSLEEGCSYESLLNKARKAPLPVSLMKELKRFAGWRGYIRGLLMVLHRHIFAKKFYLPPVNNADIANIKSRIVFLSLDQNETRYFVNKCKSNKTTVYGGLCAASLKALSSCLEMEAKPVISVKSPVDLRNVLNFSPEEKEVLNSGLSNFALIFEHFRGVVEKGKSFGSLASQAMEKLKKKILPDIINTVEARELLLVDLLNISPLRIAQKKIKFDTSLCISNIGNYQISTPDSAAFIKDAMFYAYDNASGPLWGVYAVTLNGRMSLVIGYPYPLIDQDQADKFTRVFMDNLKN